MDLNADLWLPCDEASIIFFLLLKLGLKIKLTFCYSSKCIQQKYKQVRECPTNTNESVELSTIVFEQVELLDCTLPYVLPRSRSLTTVDDRE